MFSKVFIFVLFGTCLGLVASSTTKEAIEQKWVGKVNELLYKFDGKSLKTYNKAHYKLEEVLNTLRQKNDEAVAAAEAKWVELQKGHEQLVNKVKASIEEKKTEISMEIQSLEGELTSSKVYELKMKMKMILHEEKVKFETELEFWYEQVNEIRKEAKMALKEIKFQDFLNKLQQKYGDELYEANKEKLIELKEKYQETKQQGKVAVEEKKVQYKKQLAEVEGEEYQELKIKAKNDINAEKFKWKLAKKQIEQQFREIIQNMELQANPKQNPIQSYIMMSRLFF